jgi:hypothetical protein
LTLGNSTVQFRAVRDFMLVWLPGKPFVSWRTTSLLQRFPETGKLERRMQETEMVYILESGRRHGHG